MAILEHEVRAANGIGLNGLRRYLFKRDDYYAMSDAGVFEDKQVELIEGEIVEMAPIGDGHAAVNDALAVALREVFGVEYTVRTQAPIALGSEFRPSNPQPDIAVVIGPWRQYFSRKPVAADIVLIVEIAESSLSIDRSLKAPLYASAGIAEYWIINMVDGQLETYRSPQDGIYTEMKIYRAGDAPEPQSTPGKPIEIADFLP